MNTPLCDGQWLLRPTKIEVEGLYPWFICNCILNAILSITAITFNIGTILALRRASSLSKPLRTLLLSLAVSDLGVGLLVQPLYIVVMVKWLQMSAGGGPNCALFTTYNLIGTTCSLSSFLGVMSVSADRFLAIQLHLRYRELVTNKRAASAAVALWVLSGGLALTIVMVPLYTALSIISTIDFVCFVVSGMFYCRIYLCVRHHRNQIQALHVQQQIEQHAATAANLASRIKEAVGTFYAYLVFLMCFLPAAFIFAATSKFGLSNAVKISIIFCPTLVFLNSSLNPVIYCLKMRDVRHAMMDMMREVFPSHTRGKPQHDNTQGRAHDKGTDESKPKMNTKPESRLSPEGFS